MKVKRAILITICVLGLAAGAGASEVVTIDARTFGGKLLGLSEAGLQFQTEKEKIELAMAEVSRISLAAAAEVMAKPDTCVVVTVGGSKLAATDFAVAENNLNFANPALGRVTLPLSAVSMIYFPAGRTAGDAQKICSDLKVDRYTMDVLIVQRKAGDFAMLEGVLKAIDHEGVAFARNDKDSHYALSSVLAVRLASPQGQTPAGGGVTFGNEGSQLQFSTIAMENEQLVVQCELGRVKLPLSAGREINFLSRRVTKLSALTPWAVSQHGLLDGIFEYKVNKAVDGQKLSLQGQRYTDGLGLHSFCELTYKPDGEYSTLVALAGIDDAVRPAGNARLTILGDQKELQAVDLTGRDKPVMLRVKLEGVRELTIRVDFGADKIDVADHVDLVDAKLIKK